METIIGIILIATLYLIYTLNNRVYELEKKLEDKD